METSTQKIETGLNGGLTFTRYAWAYNECGHSFPLVMTATTLAFSCGNTVIYKQHTVGNVAPVNKSASYGTVTNIPGETSKCWITSNLGSDHQATAVDDDTEPSAGWYWQFNKPQGYKHDGIIVTPAWTITYIYEDSEWVLANDPCAIELGSGWRVPTWTEWDNIRSWGEWINWNDPWSSDLKLHAAGAIYSSYGTLIGRGGSGRYWSSTQWDFTHSLELYFTFNTCSPQNDLKAGGNPIRCIE